MIKTVTFPEAYDLLLEKKTQKRFPHRTIKPDKHGYSREKHPYMMFDLFPKGLVIEFNDGVNIIVGENGSGKSTLLSLIKQHRGTPYADVLDLWDKYKDEEDYLSRYQEGRNTYIDLDGNLTYKNSVFFDGEKDNPVVAIPKMIKPSNMAQMGAQLFWASEESHGESMLPALDYILDNAQGGYVICMDEPETALSLKNQIRLANKIKKSAKKYKNQLIISTHSLALINEFFTIFDMETREWVSREEYVNDIY